MNQATRAVLLSLVFVVSVASAQFTGPSTGTSRGSPTVTTAAGVASLLEGTDVTLTGHIVAHVRSDHFTFRDASGEVRVEIDDDIWKGRKVGPETRVRITGEVDRDRSGRYVDVEALELVN